MVCSIIVVMPRKGGVVFCLYLFSNCPPTPVPYTFRATDIQAVGIRSPSSSTPPSQGRQLRRSQQPQPQKEQKQEISPGDKEYRATKTWSVEELQLLWELKTKDREWMAWGMNAMSNCARTLTP